MEIREIETPTQNIIFFFFLSLEAVEDPAVPAPAKAPNPAKQAPQKGSFISSDIYFK